VDTGTANIYILDLRTLNLTKALKNSLRVLGWAMN
jgi:hypothetical protein